MRFKEFSEHFLDYLLSLVRFKYSVKIIQFCFRFLPRGAERLLTRKPSARKKKNVIYMQCTFISLEDITYDVNLFYPQALVSTKSSKFCTYFVFPGLFRDDMIAARFTSLGCLYRLELHLYRLFLVYQQGFFYQQVFLGRF